MRLRLALASTAVLALPLGVVLAMPGEASPGGNPYPYPAVEVGYVRSILPFIDNWQAAIKRRDKAAAVKAGETYEVVWQGVEVYVNHRSLPLYQDIEPATQFVMDAELEKATPDWSLLRRLGDHLEDDAKAVVALSAAGPRMTPLFDDLTRLRAARAYVNVVRNALAVEPDGDRAKATAFLGEFEARFPAVQELISFRSAAALGETEAALAALQAKLAGGAPIADVRAAAAAFAGRLGFGVNLLNAAARGTDRFATGVTDAHRVWLADLNALALGVRANVDPAAAATGARSNFAKVQPVLEAKARSVNAAEPLRLALAAFAAAPDEAKQRAVLDQVDIARQVVVGQFWGDAGLQSFLAGLPA